MSRVPSSGPIAPVSIIAVLMRVAPKAQRLFAAWKNRREINRLVDLDERTLRDIGLTHAAVRGALGVSLLDDPSRMLAHRHRPRVAMSRQAQPASAVAVAPEVAPPTARPATI
jgi:uncharacterized protein YjiS (DUF1127 family)